MALGCGMRENRRDRQRSRIPVQPITEYGRRRVLPQWEANSDAIEGTPSELEPVRGRGRWQGRELGDRC